MALQENCWYLMLFATAFASYEDGINVDILCGKNGIGVRLAFDEPFEGVIFSKGFYEDSACRYVAARSNANVSTFDVAVRSCGTALKVVNGTWILSNTIIVQKDAVVQTSSDKAVHLYCKFGNGTKEMTVKMRDRMASSEAHSVEAWLRFFSGSNPVDKSIVSLGDKITVSIFIKDDAKQYGDARVTNCTASETMSSESLKLIDEAGCATRSRILSEFSTSLSDEYEPQIKAEAELTVFRFTESRNVYLSCDVELCKDECRDVCDHSRRIKRSSPGTAPDLPNGRLNLSNFMQSTLNAFSRLKSSPQVSGPPGLRKRSDSYQNYGEDEVSEETNAQDDSPPASEQGKRRFSDETVKLRVTASLIVLSSEEATEVRDCSPTWRFTLMTFFLSLLSISLIITCTYLVCYIRKEKKMDEINRFLLYSYK